MTGILLQRPLIHFISLESKKLLGWMSFPNNFGTLEDFSVIDPIFVILAKTNRNLILYSRDKSFRTACVHAILLKD